MLRKAFYMEVQDGKLAEYTKAHNPIPDEIRDVLKKHGVKNYSIFHHPGDKIMFGYLEVEDEEEFNKIASYECCHKWWKRMTNYLVCANEGDSKAKEEPMEMVFHLD